MPSQCNRIIAVFAHNEGRKILNCLESIRRAIRDGDQCYVLDNGSSDNTGVVVQAYAKEHPFCKLVTIELGDKANAWNVFVHDQHPEAGLYCFTDGDCEVAPDALNALESATHQHPDANAVAGVPDQASSLSIRNGMLASGGLAGGLYALTASFVQRIREQQVRLPIGLIGDDSLVGALAYWNLNPQGPWDLTRVVVCAGAEFSFTRLSMLSPRDMRLYYRRKTRYALRDLQTSLLKGPIEAQGLTVIPAHVEELYTRYGRQLKLRWRGLDTWFDYLALRKVRAHLAAH